MSRPCESAFLLAISPAEANTLGVGVVQNFDGVVVKDRDAGVCVGKLLPDQREV